MRTVLIGTEFREFIPVRVPYAELGIRLYLQEGRELTVGAHIGPQPETLPVYHIAVDIELTGLGGIHPEQSRRKDLDVFGSPEYVTPIQQVIGFSGPEGTLGFPASFAGKMTHKQRHGEGQIILLMVIIHSHTEFRKDHPSPRILQKQVALVRIADQIHVRSETAYPRSKAQG